jgi:hypothetical protein
MRGGGKDGERDDQRDDKKGDKEETDEEEQDKNPYHAYKDLDRTIRTIFGGKVALETGRQRKLTTQAVMVLAKSDEKTADSKY